MMKIVIRLCAGATAAFLLCLLVIVIAFYHLMRIGEFQRFLAGQIEQGSGMKVTLGSGDLELGQVLGVTFKDLALTQPGEAQPAITAQRVTARVALAPLLSRRLVFYEIRLEGTAARFVRNPKGQIPLLDVLLNLPFFQTAGGQFTLDLRAVHVSQGELELLDQHGGDGNLTTRLHRVVLKLERLRGEALRNFFRQRLAIRQEPLQGAALKFELSGQVDKAGPSAQLQASGMMVLPSQQVEWKQAWWQVDAQARGVPAAMAKAYLGGGLRARSIDGALSPRLTFENNPEDGMRVKGTLVLHQLALDAPEIFLAPVALGDGNVQLDVTWRRNEWSLSRLELKTRELNISIEGTLVSAESADPELRLNLGVPSMTVATLRKYLPRNWRSSPRVEKVLSALQNGELKIAKAGIRARLSELAVVVAHPFDERIWFDVEFRDVGAEIPGGYLPVRRAHGRINLEDGSLTFKGVSGEYGRSRIASLEGSYRLSPAGKLVLTLLIKGEADLAELREQLLAGVLMMQGTAAASWIQEINGRGKFELALTLTADSLPQVTGRLTLEDVSLRAAELAFSQLRGDVTFNPIQIKSERLRARLAGAPVQIEAALENYADPGGVFDLSVQAAKLPAGLVTRLLLSNGVRQDPGYIGGHVRYRGSLRTKESRQLTGSLTLANVQLTAPPLLQPLRELSGRVTIDEQGIEFENLKGLLVGMPAGFTGRWHYAPRPHLTFEFSAPRLDVTYLVSQIDLESSDFYANLQADGRIIIDKGRIKAFDFSNFKSDVVIDRRVWWLKNPTFRSNGGSISGRATIVDRPETLGIAATPKVQGVPLQTLLNWFEFTNTEITGKVNLAGRFETTGRDGSERKKNLEGSYHLRIEDGTIHRLRVLVQILNLLDLSRWFTLQIPDLKKEGIRFRSITGDFKVNKGVYTTENLLVDSDDLRMTGAGKVDVPNERIDFVIAVRPFAGIDTAFNTIPLIGRGIAAVKNSFLVASFNVSGSIDHPTITPAPLSTVSEWIQGVLGIPKSVIGLGDKKENPTPGNAPAAPARDK